MQGQEFTTTDSFDDATVGPWGYPVRAVLSIDKPVIVNVAFKPFAYWNRVRWGLEEIEWPAGEYRLRALYGIRFRTANSDPATITAVTLYKEDPIVESFSAA